MTDTTTEYFGTVKKYDNNFGFIIPDESTAHGGKDMFVHKTAVIAAGLRLSEGGRIAYTVEMHEPTNRQCAANLKLV